MYKNLANAISIFSEELDLDREQNIFSLNQSIKNGHINVEQLRSEFKMALSNSIFDWKVFTNEACLFFDNEFYQNKDIVNYVKYLIWEYLFPKESLQPEKIADLIENANKIIKDKNNIGVDELYKNLLTQQQYSGLDYFYMYHVWNKIDDQINREFNEKKPMDMGGFHYKNNSIC